MPAVCAQRAAGAGDGAVAGAVGSAIVMGVLSAILGGGGHGRWAARRCCWWAAKELAQARPISAPWLFAACKAELQHAD